VVREVFYGFYHSVGAFLACCATTLAFGLALASQGLVSGVLQFVGSQFVFLTLSQSLSPAR
jgi:hypothetical protein